MTIENNAVSRSPVYGVDRVTIWLDRLASGAEFEDLREHCTCLSVTNDQPKFQANRKCKLDLFQPTRKCLTSHHYHGLRQVRR